MATGARKTILAALFLLAAPALIWLGADLLRSGEPLYRLQELLFRHGRFDGMIRQSAARHGLDPLLVKALVWRESRFRPDISGAHGERGLMQVTEGAAKEWAKAEAIEPFLPNDLLEPRTNLRAGCWYLANALQRWHGHPKATELALAQYNAGHSRAARWEANSRTNRGPESGLQIDIASTREYIDGILHRRDYYRRMER